MKTILERAKDILNLSYIKKVDETPEWMPKQKKLIEFARDAAEHIISTQQSQSSRPNDTYVTAAYICPECGENHFKCPDKSSGGSS